MINLVEIDSLEAIVIVDNELDPLSWISPGTVDVKGNLVDIALSQDKIHHHRGNAKEIPMEAICCGAHGLSVLLTASRDGVKHSVLFDTGPEEDVFERNAARLGVDLSCVEIIQLSHWHRDHSGGMLKAIQMVIEQVQLENDMPSLKEKKKVGVDLHPSRPTYRGFNFGDQTISLPADPTILEIQDAGGIPLFNTEPHTILEDMFLVSGYIPGVVPYETGLRNGLRFNEDSGLWVEDEAIADERFLMCNLKGKGIVMLTGCSHRGVVNASKEAVKLLGGNVPLYAVLGGYHLASGEAEKVEQTVKDLKVLDPKVLLPGHCSGWRVKFEIEKELPGRLVPCTVGSRISF